MSDKTNIIRWYQNELEIKNDPDIQIPINSDEIEAVIKDTKGTVSEDRLKCFFIKIELMKLRTT